MMPRDHSLLITLLIMVALLLGATIPLILLELNDWAITIAVGFFISFVYIVLAYFTIRQAFGKSTRDFYRIMFGGMAFRFLFFLLCLFIVYKMTSLPIIGFVLAFMVFYVIFQIFEARLVLREMKKQKSA
jgi:hypothetical protein